MGVKLYRGAYTGGKKTGGKKTGGKKTGDKKTGDKNTGGKNGVSHKSTSLGLGGGSSHDIKHDSDGLGGHINGVDDTREPDRLSRLGEKVSGDKDHNRVPTAPDQQSIGGSKQPDMPGKESNDDVSNGQNGSAGGPRKSGSPQGDGGGKSDNHNHNGSFGTLGGQHDGGPPKLNDSQKPDNGHSNKDDGSNSYFGTSGSPNGAGGRGGHGKSSAGQKDGNGGVFKPHEENNAHVYPLGQDISGGQGFSVADNARGGVVDGGSKHNGHGADQRQGQNSSNESYSGGNYGKSENNRNDGPGGKNTGVTGGEPGTTVGNLGSASGGAPGGNKDGGNNGSPNKNGNNNGLGGENHGGPNGNVNSAGQTDGKNNGDIVRGAAGNVGDGSGSNAPSLLNGGTGSGKSPHHEPPPSPPQAPPNNSGLTPHKLSSTLPPHTGDQGSNQPQHEPPPSRPQLPLNSSDLTPHKLSSTPPPHAGDQGNNQPPSSRPQPPPDNSDLTPHKLSSTLPPHSGDQGSHRPQHEPPPSRPQPPLNNSDLTPHKLSSIPPPHVAGQGSNQPQPELPPQPETPSQPDPSRQSLRPLHKATPIAADTIPPLTTQRHPPPSIHHVYLPKSTTPLPAPVTAASTYNDRLKPDNTSNTSLTIAVTTSGIFTTDSTTTLSNGRTSIVETTASGTETILSTHSGNPSVISSQPGTSKAIIGGVITVAAIAALGLIVFWILRCKCRRKLSSVASETEVASSRQVQSTLPWIWRPRKSPFSATPQPFLSLPSRQHFSCDKQEVNNHVQSPLPPNWNNHGDLEQGVDPFRDPVTVRNILDNGGAQGTKDRADFQSFENPFETEFQRLSVSAQFEELLTGERFRPEERRHTPCYIYTLRSRPDNPSSAPPSYRTHND